MKSTPIGPRPPQEAPPPEPEQAPDRPAESPAETQTPAEEPAIRSIRPSATPSDAAGTARDEDPSIILDPMPWTESDPAFAESQSQADIPWWDFGARAEASNSLFPSLLLAAGVVLAMIVMMRMLRRRHGNRVAVPDSQDRIAAIHERATGSIGPIERTMSEAEQLSRRLAASMENKAARLELLIEEADRKLDELNKAVAQVSRATPVAERPRPGRAIDPSVLDLARVEQDRAERNGHHARDHAEPKPVPPADQQAEHREHHADPVHRRVWALADDGMPTLEIARSLNQPIGQIELILNLRKSG
ncbi:MAG: hypothetical protein LAT64_02250 [Phycisphaerales bacterium]|nr:hypothetical protein [Planctomycetota bacterium]MCH8507580.1 hypothetical protein [Phycisphaerales bacterium]